MTTKNGVKIIPVDISETWDNKTALKEQAKRILATAKDEKRDLTKEEAGAIADLIKLSDQIDEQVYRMAGAKMEVDDEITSLYMGANRPKNLWGDTAVDLVRGNYEGITKRGLTSTTGAAVLQDPMVTDKYIETLTHNNPMEGLGFNFVRSENYAQVAAASGEPVVVYQAAEGDAITPDTAWSLQSYKASYCTAACIIKASKQLILDGGNIGSIIQTELDTAFKNSMMLKMMQGSGSGEPTGLDSLSGINTDDIGGSAFTYDDFIDWSTTIHANRARPDQVRFLLGASSWGYVAKLKDSQSRYQEKPELLRAQTWVMSSAVKENYASTRTKIYGGNFENSSVIFQGGAGFTGRGYGGMMVLDQLYAGTLETGFLAWLRFDIKHYRPSQLIRIDGVPLT